MSESSSSLNTAQNAAVNHTNNNTNTNNSFRLTPEQQLQYQVEQRHLELYRQNSYRSTKHITKNDLESKINRL